VTDQRQHHRLPRVVEVDDRSAVRFFDYDGVLYRNQPGFDPSTCPFA
jgi:hypothetical protein